MAIPPKRISTLTLAFTGTLIAASWVSLFPPTVNYALPRLTGEDSAKSIPVQTQLLPRPSGGPVGNTNPLAKSSEATDSTLPQPGPLTQQSIFQSIANDHPPQTMVDLVADAPIRQPDGAGSVQKVTANNPYPQLIGEDSIAEPTGSSDRNNHGLVTVTVKTGEPTEPLPKPIVIPSALKEIAADSVPSPLSTVQEQAVARVQESFVKDIGGEDQVATDPEYKARWLTAQPIADQRLRAQIGDEAFREYQKALVRSAVATQGNVNP